MPLPLEFGSLTGDGRPSSAWFQRSARPTGSRARGACGRWWPGPFTAGIAPPPRLEAPMEAGSPEGRAGGGGRIIEEFFLSILTGLQRILPQRRRHSHIRRHPMAVPFHAPARRRRRTMGVKKAGTTVRWKGGNHGRIQEEHDRQRVRLDEPGRPRIEPGPRLPRTGGRTRHTRRLRGGLPRPARDIRHGGQEQGAGNPSPPSEPTVG